MRVNANYTWLKCKECGLITKILPGQTFKTKEDLADLFKCNCVEEVSKTQPKPKKVVKDAT